VIQEHNKLFPKGPEVLTSLNFWKWSEAALRNNKEKQKCVGA